MKKVICIAVMLCMLIGVIAGCGSADVLETSGKGPQSSTRPTATSGTTDNAQNGGLPEADGGTDTTPEGGGTSGGEESADEFVPVLRFVATSDIHVNYATDSLGERNKEKVRQIIAQIYAMSEDSSLNDGYVGLDAVLIAGDLVEGAKTDTNIQNRISEFNAAKQLLDSVIRSGTELVVTMGNHDCDPFETGTKGDFEALFGSVMKDVKIGGYHFITVHNDLYNGWNYSQSTVNAVRAMIEAAIADTGKNKPIFVVQHIPNTDTVVGSCSHTSTVSSSNALYEMMSEYSNLVVFSGHSHMAANDACSIHQKDFTSINTGGLSSVMKNRVQIGSEITSIDSTDNYSVSQVQLVELDASGKMRVRHWDSTVGGFVGQTWIVDSYVKGDFVYTEERFADGDLFFAEDAALSVKTFSTSAVISIPALPTESLAARLFEVVLKDSSDNILSRSYTCPPYYSISEGERVLAGVSNLVVGRTYTVEVRGVNPLYCVSVGTEQTLYTNMLSATFIADAAEDHGADIVDLVISASDGSVMSTVGLKAELLGSPEITYDESIGKDVVNFNADCNNSVRIENYLPYEATIKDGFAIESYLKLGVLPNGVGSKYSIISACESGGFSLEYYRTDANTTTFRFLLHNGSSYVKVNLDNILVPDRYYHIVATYDGSVGRVYIDGVLAGTSASVGALNLAPATTAKHIFLGGDTTSMGNCITPAKCTIAGFKLYSYALSAEQVTAAYLKVAQ